MRMWMVVVCVVATLGVVGGSPMDEWVGDVVVVGYSHCGFTLRAIRILEEESPCDVTVYYLDQTLTQEEREGVEAVLAEMDADAGGVQEGMEPLAPYVWVGGTYVGGAHEILSLSASQALAPLLSSACSHSHSHHHTEL